jgi:dTDP-4-dehydrorhamnose reductase
MRIMVIGGSGYLGREVVRQAVRAGHEVTATFHSKPVDGRDDQARWHRLDVTARPDVASAISEARPHCVINTAFRQSDWAITATGPANIALAAAACGAHMVQVSSDAVFSGDAPTYTEGSTPDPITPYGAAKAAAETAVQAIDPTAAIVRTSLILGDGHSTHERLVKALISGESQGVLFTDDVRCPVHVTDLAGALLEIADRRHHGVLHAGGADAVSRYDLGCMIARRHGLAAERLRPGLRAALPTPGPIAIRLDSSRTRSTLRTRLRGATEFLARHGSEPPFLSGRDRSEPPLLSPENESAPPFLSAEDERLAVAATAAGAMAVVVCPDGIVLHLRDDKPGIPHPGRWSLFGGAVEEGETPSQAVRRELHEELAISDAELRALWRVVDGDGDGRLLTVFEAHTRVPASEMVLAEGQAFRPFDIGSALDQHLAGFCRRVLERYAAR